jgi:hypothetical protein
MIIIFGLLTTIPKDRIQEPKNIKSIPVSIEFNSLWRDCCQISNEWDVWHLNCCPTELKDHNKTWVIQEFNPKPTFITNETRIKNERKTTRNANASD